MTTDNELELEQVFHDDHGPPMTKLMEQANSSYFTEETDMVSLSEAEGEHDDGQHCTGAIRICDFLCDDETDSLSFTTFRSSLEGDMEDEVSLPGGIPREIAVLSQDAPMGRDQVTDVHQRLLIAETLAQTFKAKMQSADDLTDNLHAYLRQAQTYAEDVLADRDELLQQIQEMQENDQAFLDQYMLLKFIMASSLCYYICGGSPILLTCSVFLNLLVDTLNAFV